ncbi:putative dimethyladenosine transferase [Dorcoceras hygrometricum]|uniref:Putative dimethyladenosine transferase n=1 Tax=Dorcoceras hygrometricum TaxID=472368 RepID=A0A2Z7D4U6_9LAMI|nr:putative dimethyladenosine transferase [Dorcoceras hygrometricum]
MFSSWFDVLGSAVELAMETSRVDSVVCNQAMAKVEPADDEDQLEAQEKKIRVYNRKIQQVACIPDARGSDVVLEAYPVASYSAISRCYLKIAIAKRCRLHKLIRQRFAVALKIQQEDFALMFNQQAQRNQQVATALPVESLSAVATHPVARFPGAKN